MDIAIMSVPIAGQLSIGGLQVDAARRKELRQLMEAGELDALEFDAVVWRDGPNANYFRFREGDLGGFGESYGGQPFLRNHDVWDIGSRDGTVVASAFDGRGFLQTIGLTTERGIRSFVEGQIDRFSIGWYYDGITCSICGGDWLGPGCVHWPGRTYTDGEGKNPRVCELIFENPKGKETSAVNAPAVDGTRILAQLCEQKERNLRAKQEVEDMDEKDKALNGVKDKSPITNVVAEPVQKPVVAPPAPGPLAQGQKVEPAPIVEPVVAQPAVLGESELKPVADWLAYMKQQALDVALAGSGLPVPMQAAIRLELAGREDATPALVEEAIERQRTLWAELQKGGVVQGMGRPLDAGDVTTPMDEITLAMEWVFGVPDAKTPVPSLRKMDELYRIITGDGRFRGLFDPDQAKLAGADTTTLADIAVDSMNKVMIDLYDGLGTYRWFEPLVSVQPHDGSTHDMKWIQFGGIGELPVVKERGAYTELDVADTKESDAFVKRGGYVGITREMIRKSEIALIQAIPKTLIRSSVLTRSACIAGIFTANSGVGPTMDQDSKALFHADHGNLATTSFSWAAWKAARLECFKQTELGSGKRQGLWPAYCLVPGDLYDDALIYFGYGQGTGGKPTTTDKDVNPYGESRPGDPRPVVVAVPDWTDAFKWAYLANPKLAPVIMMSYEQLPGGGKHPLPELFSVTSRNSGLLFTNDLLPIKVLDELAYGVATHRGIGKRNATS